MELLFELMFRPNLLSGDIADDLCLQCTNSFNTHLYHSRQWLLILCSTSFL